MAWLPGWYKRIELTIDSGDVDNVLANFPVLVYLSTSSGISSADVSAVFDELAADANRKKIAITTSDGITQCYVEIEKWDDASEEAWLWVKVPSVASGADTILYLYYDVAQADNNTYVGDTNSVPAETVWDANFKLVCHMRDDPDTSHVRDSTSNDNDGTKQAAGEPAVTTNGKIADAQDFDGINDRVATAGSNGFATLTQHTLEIWYRQPTLPSVVHTAIEIDTEPYGLVLNINQRNDGAALAGAIRLHILDSAGGAKAAVGTNVAVLTATQHDYIVHHFDQVALKGYVNAVEKCSVAFVGTPDFQATPAVYVGATPTLTNDCVGIMDEVRISNVARGVAWIKASYESEIDDLLTFGAEEAAITPKGSMTAKMIAAGLI